MLILEQGVSSPPPLPTHSNTHTHTHPHTYRYIFCVLFSRTVFLCNELTSGSTVFFLPRASKKCPCKPFLAIFSIFARALFDLHAHFFTHFSLFSRPLFFARVPFWIFYTGSKIFCTGRHLIFCTRRFFICTGTFCLKKKQKTKSNSSEM